MNLQSSLVNAEPTTLFADVGSEPAASTPTAAEQAAPTEGTTATTEAPSALTGPATVATPAVAEASQGSESLGAAGTEAQVTSSGGDAVAAAASDGQAQAEDGQAQAEDGQMVAEFDSDEEDFIRMMCRSLAAQNEFSLLR